MVAHRGAAEFVPERGGLAALRRAAEGCRGCDLHVGATRVVFGEGPAKARVMMVGEQPGDREDLAGHPFVGPAGKLLDRALEAVGLVRSEIYFTNAVKHFRFEQRGERRIHQQPTRGEVVACLPWLTAEVRAVRPELVVCLGAVAAKALLGPSFSVSERRGEVERATVGDRECSVLTTVHPSAVLRSDDREAAFEEFARDLEAVHAAL
ncbi:UdgX family uracil-DNA binding protein [Umezawaea sp.]|uniref:UdgX family uracil-DNA binding protein n=1 Tax=Umezawaea sp. TaxID=1955258 RepID=UPI002ED05150